MMNVDNERRHPLPQATKASDSGERHVAVKSRLHSDTLLAGRREIVIEHCGEEYRLRVTSKGKLILTK